MRGRRSLAAGLFAAAAVSSTVGGFAIAGTLASASPPGGCRQMSPPISRSVSGQMHAQGPKKCVPTALSKPVAPPHGHH
jgi:hypothetical protein